MLISAPQRVVWYLFLSGLLLLRCASVVWQKVDLAKRQGKFTEAAHILETYLSEYPQDAKGRYQLGEIYGEQKQWKSMLKSFNASLSQSSRWKLEIAVAKKYYWAENFNQGILAFKAGDASSAVSLLQNAVLILPDIPETHRFLGEAAYVARQPQLAITAFTKALQRDGKDSRSGKFLMRIFFENGAYEKAISAAEQLQTFLPANLEARRIIAFSYDRLNNTQQAQSAYEILEKHSQTSKDYEAFAAFSFRMGEYSEVIRLSRKAIELGGDKVRNLRAIAQVKLIIQNFRGLIKTVEAILEIKKDDIAALQLLQIAHAALGEIKNVKVISSKIKELESINHN